MKNYTVNPGCNSLRCPQLTKTKKPRTEKNKNCTHSLMVAAPPRWQYGSIHIVVTIHIFISVQQNLFIYFFYLFEFEQVYKGKQRK